MGMNTSENRLAVALCGLTLKNPVITASGTFGYGREYNEFYPVARLGAIACKGTSAVPWEGNPPPRIAETPAGMLNSVGLQNPGVDALLSDHLPWLKEQGATVIVNVAGHSLEDYCAVAERLDGSAADMLELNISCPNVREGGLQFGVVPEMAARVTAEVRRLCRKPLMVKLTPNVTDVGELAAAVEAAGADAVSLINTLTGMRIDIRTRRPVLHNNVGGLSGAAVFPVAVRMVHEVYRRVKIPVVGMGGISTWEDAVEMMLAGATAVQVGTANFRDPLAAVKIIDGLERYAAEQNLDSITALTGAVREWERVR